MINGILYKSSTSRLTKAYSSSSSLSHPSTPGTTAVAAMSSASLSRSKLNSSVIVRSESSSQFGVSFAVMMGVEGGGRVQSFCTYINNVQSFCTYINNHDAVLLYLHKQSRCCPFVFT